MYGAWPVYGPNAKFGIAYWEIRYKDVDPNVHNCGDRVWLRIKDAIDMWNDMDVYLRSTDNSGTPIDDGSTYPGGGGIFARHPIISVNYAELTQHPLLLDGQPGSSNLVQRKNLITGQPFGPANQAEDPFFIVLYHELLGHGYMYVNGIPGFDAKHDDSVPEDPVIRAENDGRHACNCNSGTALGERNHMH